LNDRRPFVHVNNFIERKTTPTLGSSVSEPLQAALLTVVVTTPDLSTVAGAVIEAATLPRHPPLENESIQTLVSASTVLIEKADEDHFPGDDLSVLPEAEIIQSVSASRCPPLIETDNGLLGATSKSPDDMVLWFDRELITPINYDLSDDEEDDEYVDKAAPSKSSSYGDLMIDPQAVKVETARIASDSDKSSAQVSTLQSPASRSSSISSQSSQTSVDVQPNGVLLGNTRARDLMDLFHPVEGLISKQ
jgi:hypothetical protein